TKCCLNSSYSNGLPPCNCDKSIFFLAKNSSNVMANASYSILWYTACTSSSASILSISLSTSAACSSSNAVCDKARRSSLADFTSIPFSSKRLCIFPKSSKEVWTTTISFPSSSASTYNSSNPPSINSNSSSSTSKSSAAAKRKIDLRLKMKSKEPVFPKEPPDFVKYDLMLATVRLVLSVAVSINTGTPCGPYPSYTYSS